MRNNPYRSMHDEGRQPIKANFHTHAGVCNPRVCGELPMDDVVEAYRRAGYGALAISNHNLYLPHPSYPGIAVLDAVEYSAHPHMLLVGTSQYHDVGHQEAIDLARAEGAFVVLNHPNWMRHNYWPFEDMVKLNGYIGLEIFNPVIFRLKGSGLALDAWDALLSTGRQAWGFGNDDFHVWEDIARAYNVIYAKSSAFEDIKAAVEEGCFYVSSGLALKSLTLTENSVSVEAGFFVETYVDTFEYTLTGQNGRVIDSAVGRSAAFTFDPHEPYIRVTVTDESGAKLYTQPMMLR